MIRLPWRRRLQAGSAAAPIGDATVQGERSGFIASRARSLQSRMASLLAAALMTSVGAGMLAWYYAQALSRPAAAHALGRDSLPPPVGEGLALPTFAAPAAGMRVLTAPAASVPPAAPVAASSPAVAQAAPGLPYLPLLGPPLARAPAGFTGGEGARPQSSARQQPLDRRLSGEVFAAVGAGAPAPVAAAQAQAPETGPRGDALQTLLRPALLSAAHAQILPTRRLLLPKGSFIDCTLETAIDSTLPGMTTCVTATDTFSADGTVVLLERGTKLIGETRGDVRQGEARVFVVWTEARTPSGVVVQLDSPGTDALGRSGLDGKVNRHFWQRFGAALLISTIDGVVQSEIQSSSRSGTVVVDPTASEDVLNDLVRGTVNIPPTIRVRNGARIQVLVARDVDFRPVYELEPR